MQLGHAQRERTEDQRDHDHEQAAQEGLPDGLRHIGQQPVAGRVGAPGAQDEAEQGAGNQADAEPAVDAAKTRR